MDAKPLIALRQQPLLETLSLHPVHGREWNSSTDQETDTIDPSHLQHGAGRSLFGKRALFKVHHAATCSEVLAIFRASFQASMSRGSRSEEHTSELQSLMRISYAVFCLKKKNTHNKQ